ncbi:MAG: serine hydrolase domain-containing protein, partial [Bacteroidota bacterium]
MMKNKLVLFLLFLFAPCLSWGQSHSSNLISRIDSLVKRYQKSLEVPGLAVGLILDGKIVYKQAIGEQNLETKAPLTERSLFHMASVSKPFVATAVMLLVEQGKINLDEKLTTYLPYFKMADKRYSKITLRQMLQHSSGIPDVEDYGWTKSEKDAGAAERYIRTFKDSVLDFKPGKEFSYSNAAFDILADVIARASGMTFEAYMKKNIFEPVGMQNSTFYKPEVPSELATAPHWLDEELKMKVGEFYPYNRRHAPSSTLHSNVEDMLRWAQFNLNQGSFEGKQIYQTSSYQALTQAQLPVWRKDSVCLSW